MTPQREKRPGTRPQLRTVFGADRVCGCTVSQTSEACHVAVPALYSPRLVKLDWKLNLLCCPSDGVPCQYFNS